MTKSLKIVLSVCLTFLLTFDAESRSVLDGVGEGTEICLPDTEFDGSVSVVAKAKNGGRVVVVFPSGQDAEPHAIEMQIRDAGIGEEYWTPTIEYSLYNLATQDCTARQTVADDFKVAGLKIVQDTYGLRFCGPGGRRLFEFDNIEIPSLTPGGKIAVHVSGSARIERICDNFHPYPRREVWYGMSGPMDKDSTSHSGEWEYLDRTTPENKVVVGGKYRVALLPDTERVGDYVIVYIEGARIDSGFWHKGDVKGRLRATPFADHYDAEWRDSRRTIIDDEVSATFESPEILRIDIPLLGTQLRFCRVSD